MIRIDTDDVIEAMGMFCDVCKGNGMPNNGFAIMDMALKFVREEGCEHSIHIYEGECPVCRTRYRYTSIREELGHTFRKVDECEEDTKE